MQTGSPAATAQSSPAAAAVLLLQLQRFTDLHAISALLHVVSGLLPTVSAVTS